MLIIDIVHRHRSSPLDVDIVHRHRHRSSASHIDLQGRCHCIYTHLLKITIRRIVHIRPAPLYLYRFAQNYDPPYRTYNARPIVFIQICTKLRSAVLSTQGRRHCIHTNWLKITISCIVHTRPVSLH